MSGKWTQVKNGVVRGWEAARNAEAARRDRRDAHVAAVGEAMTVQRQARIARATRANGVMRGGTATWDGRVLRVGSRSVRRPNDRHFKHHSAPLVIPLGQITSASKFGAMVHVTVTDGREIRFRAPSVMADAITDALAGA